MKSVKRGRACPTEPPPNIYTPDIYTPNIYTLYIPLIYIFPLTYKFTFAYKSPPNIYKPPISTFIFIPISIYNFTFISFIPFLTFNNFTSISNEIIK